MNRNLPEPSITYTFVAILALGVAWWILFEYYTQRTLEDALITFRYAQNIAQGHGFVFNPGERVLGTTTPLLTLWLALWGKMIGVDAIPMVSRVSMMTLGAATGVINYLILRKLQCSEVAALAATVFFFVNFRVVVTSVGGMETPMALFFMALSSYFVLTRADAQALLSCAFLILTRIDGVIWSAILLCVIIYREHRVPVYPVILSAVALLPWFVFAWAYFGTVLPHSIAAKQAFHSASPAAWSAESVLHFLEWYVRGIGFMPWFFIGCLFLLLFLLGVLRLLRDNDNIEQRAVAFALIGFVPAYALFLFLGHAPHFFWYLLPPIWCVMLIGTLGLDELVSWITARMAHTRVRMGVVILLMSTVAILYCISHVKRVIPFEQQYQANEHQTRRMVGLWLKDHTPDQSLIAMEAIGYQAYFSERRILDLAGIVSPAVIEIAAATGSSAALFNRILTVLKPDYLVLRSFEVDDNWHFSGGPLFESQDQRDYFELHYREMKRFTAPYEEVWGSLSYLTIYGPASDSLTR